MKRVKEKIKVVLFTEPTAAVRRVAFGGGLARKCLFSKPFKVHQSKKNPHERKSVKLQGCVGLISDHRNGNILTLRRRASLCHENIQHHRHLRHLQAVSKSTPTENDVKTLGLSKIL